MQEATIETEPVEAKEDPQVKASEQEPANGNNLEMVSSQPATHRSNKVSAREQLRQKQTTVRGAAATTQQSETRQRSHSKHTLSEHPQANFSKNVSSQKKRSQQSGGVTPRGRHSRQPSIPKLNQKTTVESNHPAEGSKRPEEHVTVIKQQIEEAEVVAIVNKVLESQKAEQEDRVDSLVREVLLQALEALKLDNLEDNPLMLEFRGTIEDLRRELDEQADQQEEILMQFEQAGDL